MLFYIVKTLEKFTKIQYTYRRKNRGDNIMQKRVLILTSYVTGHGHKSITNALEEELKNIPGLQYKAVEAFEFAGKMGLRIGKMYAPIIRTSEDMWKFIYKMSATEPRLVEKVVKRLIKRKFNKLVDEFNPNIIVTVHPAFNSAVIDLLNKRKDKKKIKFATVFADLISISPLWVDPRADLMIAPTKEAYVYALKRGTDEDKIAIINLPVRKEILTAGKKIKMVDEKAIREKKEMDFLIMSGGEGSGDMGNIIEKLLKIPNSRISAVAGRNTKLKEVLEKKFSDVLDRVTVYGFVKDVENLMTSHDVAIVRGSPNVLMECITCDLPVIVTGALPGQEEGNIDFILLNDLGILCTKETDLVKSVNKLLANDKERLIKIKKSQLAFRDLEAGKKIVEKILTLA